MAKRSPDTTSDDDAKKSPHSVKSLKSRRVLFSSLDYGQPFDAETVKRFEKSASRSYAPGKHDPEVESKLKTPISYTSHISAEPRFAFPYVTPTRDFFRVEPSAGPTRQESVRRFKSGFRQLISVQLYIPNHVLIRYAHKTVLILLVWALIYFIFPVYGEPPDGELFCLTLLITVSFIVGRIFSHMRLPPLLGQLITGVVLRSSGVIETHALFKFLSPVVRSIAMGIILLKAGLGLELQSLLALKWVIFKLTVLPCIAEACSAAVIAHFTIGCDWIWALMLGFMLSSISPAVVIPPILKLKEEGYGEDKGIATMVIAAAGLDDILSISCFSFFYSMNFFPASQAYMQLMRGPLELLIGVGVGVLWGFLCAIFPHREDKYVVIKRSLMIGIGGTTAVFCCIHFHVESSGPLICMISAFFASFGWQLQYRAEEEGLYIQEEDVSAVYKTVWVAVEPFLFGMIGAEMDLRLLKVITVLQSVTIIVGALVFRIFICFLSLLGGKLNFREMVFVNLSWIPKATVQAAIGPLPLDHLRSRASEAPEEIMNLAYLALTTAVLSILITAPIGAICIQFTGKVLLTKKVERITSKEEV